MNGIHRTLEKTHSAGRRFWILRQAATLRLCSALAIMSSIAAIRGLPSAPAYAASKAAVKSYGEGLRPSLAAHGVRVSVICPGFIKTPMTDANAFPMPFLMDANKAARIILRGLARQAPLIAFPWPLVWGLRLVSACACNRTPPSSTA